MVDLYWTGYVHVRDAWSRLGQMSSESAMAAYVDEMKKVAQEVHDLIDSYTNPIFFNAVKTKICDLFIRLNLHLSEIEFKCFLCTIHFIKRQTSQELALWGTQNSAAFLHRIDVGYFPCVAELQVAFLDAAVNCNYIHHSSRAQWKISLLKTLYI